MTWFESLADFNRREAFIPRSLVYETTWSDSGDAASGIDPTIFEVPDGTGSQAFINKLGLDHYAAIVENNRNKVYAKPNTVEEAFELLVFSAFSIDLHEQFRHHLI